MYFNLFIKFLSVLSLEIGSHCNKCFSLILQYVAEAVAQCFYFIIVYGTCVIYRYVLILIATFGNRPRVGYP